MLALVAEGCAPRPPRPLEADTESLWDARVSAVSQIREWSLTARLALRSGDRGWNAGLRWAQSDDRFEVEFTGPLGQGSGKLIGGPHGVLFRGSDGGEIVSGDAESLVRDQLGVQLPVGGLRYWVLGIPRPRSRYQKRLTEDGRLQELKQDGWRVRFLRYANIADVALPAKIEFEYGDLRVRMVVDRWRLGSSPRLITGGASSP
jgi:outer membrane lipoprotein LolB